MMKGLAQKPRLRTNKPCQNMLWQGLLSLQNDFWVTLFIVIYYIDLTFITYFHKESQPRNSIAETDCAARCAENLVGGD